MAYLDIHRALTQSIIDLNLGLPIAHENASFDSSGIDSYIRVNSLFNEQESLGKIGVDEVTGIYQISAYVKSGVSVSSTLGTIDSIMSYYKHNTTFTSGSQNVTVINAGRNEGRNESGWYMVDISISFKSDLTR